MSANAKKMSCTVRKVDDQGKAIIPNKLTKTMYHGMESFELIGNENYVVAPKKRNTPFFGVLFWNLCTI